MTEVKYRYAAIENFPVIMEYLGFVISTLIPTSVPDPISESNPVTTI
jgi:hypothetical protein